MNAAIEAAARKDATWRQFTAMSATAALDAVDRIVKKRRLSAEFNARCLRDQGARMDRDALEAARLILHDIVEAEARSQS